MRYRVELEELLAFVETLQAFEQRAETIAARVDNQVADLHDSWSGEAASAHLALHGEWKQLRPRCGRRLRNCEKRRALRTAITRTLSRSTWRCGHDQRAEVHHDTGDSSGR